MRSDLRPTRLFRPSPTIVFAVGASLAALALAPARATAQDAAAPRATADSTFTDAQAGRGAQVFTRVCLECHAREDMSNADFKGKWGGQTTFDLFKNISTTMPDNNPGMLAANEYVDVVAYILKLNGVASGGVELAADTTAMKAAKLNLPAAAGADLVQQWHAAGRRTTTRVAFAHSRPVPRPLALPHAPPSRAAGGR